MGGGREGKGESIGREKGERRVERKREGKGESIGRGEGRGRGRGTVWGKGGRVKKKNDMRVFLILTAVELSSTNVKSHSCCPRFTGTIQKQSLRVAPPDLSQTSAEL